MNKRGQGLSTTAIVLIVLGVLILVFLILGFSIGWKKIVPWLSQSNVDEVKQQCNIACNTNSKYNFCSMKRELKAETSFTDTCYYYAKKQSKYGITLCSALTCEVYDDEDAAKAKCKDLIKDKKAGSNELTTACGTMIDYFTPLKTESKACKNLIADCPAT